MCRNVRREEEGEIWRGRGRIHQFLVFYENSAKILAFKIVYHLRREQGLYSGDERYGEGGWEYARERLKVDILEGV